jgi:hypothetical protein
MAMTITMNAACRQQQAIGHATSLLFSSANGLMWRKGLQVLMERKTAG